MEYLAKNELLALIERVFAPTAAEQNIAILVDLPEEIESDNPRWQERRHIAWNWYKNLQEAQKEGGPFCATFYLYRAVMTNNGDLPPAMWPFDGHNLPLSAAALSGAKEETLAEIFGKHSLIMAPTEYSATAPLKLAAPTYGFKAATLPGFSEDMIPALRLDYHEVAKKVLAISNWLTKANGAEIVFKVEGRDEPLTLYLDLRYRKAHSSTGLITEKGQAGNVPSGEAYIVPYEGEVADNPSKSHGTLPVQFGTDVLFYHIEQNRAIGVTGCGPVARQESARLREEPAYGNMAELGLGVLGGFGLKPIGAILLDEKLGLHIAFGRSDHFGGQVGAGQFNDPKKMVHIDRVYVKELQPAITIERATLELEDRQLELMRGGEYNAELFG